MQDNLIMTYNRQKVIREWKKNHANEAITTRGWEDLKKRVKNKCLVCCEELPLTQDHIVPVSKEGAHSIRNIQPLCRSCNSSKGISSGTMFGKNLQSLPG